MYLIKRRYSNENYLNALDVVNNTSQLVNTNFPRGLECTISIHYFIIPYSLNTSTYFYLVVITQIFYSIYFCYFFKTSYKMSNYLATKIKTKEQAYMLKWLAILPEDSQSPPTTSEVTNRAQVHLHTWCHRVWLYICIVQAIFHEISFFFSCFQSCSHHTQ